MQVKKILLAEKNPCCNLYTSVWKFANVMMIFSAAIKMALSEYAIHISALMKSDKLENMN